MGGSSVTSNPKRVRRTWYCHGCRVGRCTTAKLGDPSCLRCGETMTRKALERGTRSEVDRERIERHRRMEAERDAAEDRERLDLLRKRQGPTKLLCSPGCRCLMCQLLDHTMPRAHVLILAGLR